MTRFTFHTTATAPAAAQPILEQVTEKYGFTPNLMAGLANAPATLEAYVALTTLMERTSFSQIERQVIVLTASVANGCSYCVAGHSASAVRQGIPNDVIDAIRSGTAIRDPRLQALHLFTVKMIEQQGWISQADGTAFLDAGFEAHQVLEVILGLAMKTISNYANQVMDTPLDAVFAGQVWHGQAAAD